MKPRSELSAREVEELHLLLARRIGDTSVPTLPQVALQVVELVSAADATIADFTKALQSDQALSGRLLRMANSAYYAQQKPVTRIDRAMVLLGLDKLKALALGFHLSKALLECDDGFSFKRQWTQSLFRAWFAHRLAALVVPELAGEAFLIGLLSDAGQPLMAQLIGERYYEVVSPSQPPTDRFRAEWNTLVFTHVDVTVALCRVWKLPEVLASPIAEHHTKPQFPVKKASPSQQIQAVAYLAGTLAIDPDLPSDAVAPDAGIARRVFELGPAEIKALLGEVEQDFRASKEVFDSVIDPSMRVEDIVERANTFLNDAVEDLVGQVGAHEVEYRPEHFEAAGLAFEIARDHANRICVYISDSTGNRLVSEPVDPSNQTGEEIRRALLLEDASEDESAPILDAIQRLAA